MLRKKSAELIDRKIGCLGNAFKGDGIAKILVDIIHSKIYGLIGAGAAVNTLSLKDGAVEVYKYLDHNAALDNVVTVTEILGKDHQSFLHLFRLGIFKMHTMVKAVLVRIEALGKIGLTSGAIVQKFGAYLKNKATEACIVVVGDLVRLVLVYNEHVVVIDLVNLPADKEAFATRETEKDLAAIVYMYVGIWVALLGIIHSEAGIAASVGDSSRAAFKNMVHKGTRFQNQEI